MKNFLRSILFVFLFLSCSRLMATHIVGGVVYYKKLSGNNYEIKLIVYRDCFYGVPPFDDPASIGFFDAVTNSLITEVLVSTADSVDVPNFVNNDCFTAPVNICYKEARYTFNVSLPANVNGYTIAYQRCCRNNSISNIDQPGATGATYIGSIPSSAFTTNNSNPVFNAFPPTFICLGFPLEFDHSATDIDGDSLVYELCTPLDGGTVANPAPQPPFNPPYSQVTYVNPYSQSNMLNAIAGGVPLSIDPQTGLLTATPSTIGQFVVGVCVREYRNNVFLGATRRDFQFNVIPCPSLIVADFSAVQGNVVTLCGTFNVDFINQSFGEDSVSWNFGDPTTLNDTSSIDLPSYTYPDTGVYQVMLIAYSALNDNCRDTAYSTVTIRPALTTDFTFTQPPCSYTVQFNDFVTNNTGTIASVNYNFGDNTSSSVSDPSHTYTPGTYTVTFTSTSTDGCMDTVQKQVTVLPIVTSNAAARPALCNGDCNGMAWAVPSSGIPPYTFLWSNNAVTDTIFNLCSGTYTVTVTDSAGCTATQTVTVTQPDPLVLNASKTDDYCGAICIGTASASATGGTQPYFYNWSNGLTGSYIKNLCQGNYTVTVTDTSGCTTQTQFVTVGLQNFYPDLDVFADDDTIFNGQTVQLTSVTNAGITYNWTPSNLLNSSTIPNPVASPTEPVTFVLSINDSLGCPVSDSVRIFVREVRCFEPAIFVPNAFTPNDDSNNDIFRVRGEQIRELLVRVYDRWGEKVFETTTAGKGWDGTYKGKKVTPGVFVYYVEAVCFDNEKFFKKGNVTVIR